jgi:hypothetical protein
MVENLIICCTNTKQNINIFFMIFKYMKVCVLIILCKLHLISNKIYTIMEILLEYKINYFSSILHVKRKLLALVLLIYHFSMNYYVILKPTSNQL